MIFDLDKKINKEKIKTWFVTGASSGVGQEFCKQLLENGYNVIAVSRRKPDFDNKNALCMSVDVTNVDEVKMAINCGIEKFGKIDVLVNNAGISANVTLEEENMEHIKKVMEINFYGSYNTMHELLPHFRKNNNGTIINNTSQSGIACRAYGSAYVSSKHALEGLTSVCWQETKSFCRVMAIEMGYFQNTGIYNSKDMIELDTQIDSYENLELFFTKIKHNKFNYLPMAINQVIKQVENKILPRRLMLGQDSIQQINAELNYIKKDLKNSIPITKKISLSKREYVKIKPLKPQIKKEVFYKNIALLNFHWENSNFGAVLTSCALNMFLNKKGYNAQNINYIPTFPWIREEQKNDLFDEFRKKYLPSTKKLYEYSQLDELNDIFNTFIVGSDQVFRYPFIKHDMEAFFLNFANLDKNIISAAASFGSEDVENESIRAKELYKLYLSNFNYLSIREKSGVDYCKNLGIEATNIIDPVFYIDKNEWEEIANNAENKNIADFVYYTINPEIEKNIKVFADQNKNLLKIDSIENITKNLSIEEWLYKIKNCKFFVADSFHGICFAIIFNKPFVCVRKQASTRMKSLLESVQIENRLYKTFEEIDINKIVQPIDYNKTNQNIFKLKEFSTNWLINAIENPINNPDLKSKNKKEILKIQLKLARKNYLKFVFKSKLYKVRAYLKKTKAQKYMAKADSARYIYRNCKFIIRKARKNNE